MKRAASLLLFTGLRPPQEREVWSVEFSMETIWNPDLSEEDRRVGFRGRKVEDINRLPVIPRPRLSVGLPWATTLELAYIPPVEVDGITPNIFALALERPLVKIGDLVLGLRAYGQIATLEGDITCTEEDAASPPGSPGNPFGCQGASHDELQINYAGLALTGGYKLPEEIGGDLHFGLYATYLDLEFQVNATTFGFLDQTLQVTDGWVYAVTLGYSRPIHDNCRVGLEAFYSPLRVMRSLPAGETSTENDGLFNLRAMVTYRF